MVVLLADDDVRVVDAGGSLVIRYPDGLLAQAHAAPGTELHSGEVCTRPSGVEGTVVLTTCARSLGGIATETVYLSFGLGAAYIVNQLARARLGLSGWWGKPRKRTQV